MRRPPRQTLSGPSSPRRIPVALLSALAAALASGACADAPPPASEPEPWPTPAQEALAMEKGTAAADALTGALIGHLTAALDEGGPEGAIEFCATEALALTADAMGTMDGVDIKRTSTRVRNPANAPDSLEALALAYFEERLGATGALPAAWLQPEGDQALRYYRPLVINQLCVQCHGPMGALPPKVLAALDARYPDDQATGYLAGDFRGLIRVRVARAVLEAAP
jgi:hypothetical protein